MSGVEEPWLVMFQPQNCPKDCRIIGCDNPECPKIINNALLRFEPRISEMTKLRIIERIRQRLFRFF
jgi:hypothetical protein